MGSEAQGIAKALIFLALVALFIGLINPSGPVSPFQVLQDELSRGPEFPVYSNPFDPEVAIFSLLPIVKTGIDPGLDCPPDGSFSWQTYDNELSGAGTDCDPAYDGLDPVGCTFELAYLCVVTNDRDTTYIPINGTDVDTHPDGFSMPMDSLPFIADATNHPIITQVILVAECRTEETSEVAFALSFSGLSRIYHGVCPRFVSYTQLTFTDKQADVPISWGSWSKDSGGNSTTRVTAYKHCPPFDAHAAGVDPCSANSIVRITHLRIDIYYEVPPEDCSEGFFTDQVACAIGNFVKLMIKLVVAFVNALVFVILTVAAIAVYVISVILGVFFGIINTAIWFFAVPGAPSTVQALISAIFLGLVGYVIVLVVRLVRGSSP